MKIKTISIENYKGIKKMDIVPKDINILTGNCGAGKSSILDAIRFVFTGKIDKNDIRKGSAKAIVEITFDDDSTVSRERDAKVQVCRVNGKRTANKMTEEYLASKLGCDVELFNAMSSVDYFKELSQKDLTDVFLSILPININTKGLMDLIDGSLKVSKERKDYIAAQFPNDDSNFGLDKLDKAYDYFVAKRKDLKRYVKNNVGSLDFNEKTLPQETKEELDKKMEEIIAKETKANSYQKTLNEYNRQVQMQKEANAKLEELKKIYVTYERVIKPDSSIYAKAKGERQQFVDAITKHNTAIATINANLSMFKNTLDNLDKPVCPISNKLICTTDKSGIKEELTSLVKQNEEVIQSHNEFIAKCQAQVAKRDKIMDEFQKSTMEYEKKSQLRNQIKDFIVPTVMEKPTEIETIDYSKAKEEIRVKSALLVQGKLYQDKKAEIDKVNKEIELCEFAVSTLDTRYGIKNDILNRVMTPFKELINKKASKLRKGFVVDFKCDNGIQILVKPTDSQEFVDMSMVSTGEFVFVAYLLMSVIQSITNENYLIIDNLDRLDKGNFEALVNLLIQDKVYEHIFIASVDHDDIKSIINLHKDAVNNIQL